MSRLFAAHNGSNQVLTPGAASASVTIPKGKSVRLVNTGANICHVRIGTAPQTATTADTPISAGSTLILGKADDDTTLAHISAAGTTLHVQNGEGGTGASGGGTAGAAGAPGPAGPPGTAGGGGATAGVGTWPASNKYFEAFTAVGGTGSFHGWGFTNSVANVTASGTDSGNRDPANALTRYNTFGISQNGGGGTNQVNTRGGPDGSGTNGSGNRRFSRANGIHAIFRFGLQDTVSGANMPGRFVGLCSPTAVGEWTSVNGVGVTASGSGAFHNFFGVGIDGGGADTTFQFFSRTAGGATLKSNTTVTPALDTVYVLAIDTDFGGAGNVVMRFGTEVNKVVTFTATTTLVPGVDAMPASTTYLAWAFLGSLTGGAAVGFRLLDLFINEG